MLQISEAQWVSVGSVRIPVDAPPPNPGLVERMVQSYRDFGQLSPILIRADGTLVSGRHRYEAAKALGVKVLARVVEGSEEAIAALRADENVMREHGLGALAECLNVYSYEVWLVARGERASVGRSGVTTQDIAARTGDSRRTVQRQLKVARTLAPAARDVLVVQPDAATWELSELLRLVSLPADRQVTLAEQVGVTPLAALLDRVVPKKPKPKLSPEEGQVARLEAFVEAGAALGGAWVALAEAVGPVLAEARELAEGAASTVADAAPAVAPAVDDEPAEAAGGRRSGSAETTAERAAEAAGGRRPGPAEATAERAAETAGGRSSGSAETTAGGEEAPEAAADRAFLEAFTSALERVGAGRLAGARPGVRTVRVTGALTPALGGALGLEVRRRGGGFEVQGRADAVAALEALLAEAPDPAPRRLRSDLREAARRFAERSPEAARMLRSG